MDEDIGATINQRVKKVRKTLKLTQHDFAKVLALSQSQIASVETKKLGVTDRTIKLICDSFNANPQWLRTGEGDMFVQKDDAKLKKLLTLFTNLQPQYQGFIFKAIDMFLKMQDGVEDEG